MKKKKAQKGGQYGGLTTKGFNYNSAWGGAWQNGGSEVDIDSVLNANKHLDFVKRMYEPNTPTISKKGESMTHFMESGDGMVYPRVIRNNKGNLKFLSSDKARKYAEKTGEYIKFDNDLDAQYFGANYKKGTGVLKEYQHGGEMKFYQEGLDWLPKSMQKGGNLPDSVSNEVMLRQLYRESRFKEKAENKGSQAKGLAQLRPIAVEELKNKYKMAVDPLNPKQAIKAHKKLMTTAYNKPWINKEGTTDEVRVAKSLAAYNWGPTSLVNALNKQKEKGVDIYKGLDWVKSLPKETQDYIYDVTGKNPKFEEEYKKAVENFKFKGAYPTKKHGGVIEDNMGQWKHPGEVTKINSNNITMQGVPYPVLGVSNTGDQKMMYPDQNYKFEGSSVTEYPQIEPINWLNKYEKAQEGTSILSYLNPKNWGVDDYSRERSFNEAFRSAKKHGLEEFLYNGKRYNTKSNLPPSEQMKLYGIPDEQRLSQTGVVGTVRKNLASNLYPGGYSDVRQFEEGEYAWKPKVTTKEVSPITRVLKAGVFGIKESQREWEDQLFAGGNQVFKDRVDYNNLYFGKPQQFNTKKVSDFKPAKSKDDKAVYYTSDKIKETLRMAAMDSSRFLDKDNHIDRKELVSKGNTGGFTLTKGKDEKGEYLSYYDTWDLSPMKKIPGSKDESRGLGKPFEIYDRIYYPLGIGDTPEEEKVYHNMQAENYKKIKEYRDIENKKESSKLENGGWLNKYK